LRLALPQVASREARSRLTSGSPSAAEGEMALCATDGVRLPFHCLLPLHKSAFPPT